MYGKSLISTRKNTITSTFLSLILFSLFLRYKKKHLVKFLHMKYNFHNASRFKFIQHNHIFP